MRGALSVAASVAEGSQSPRATQGGTTEGTVCIWRSRWAATHTYGCCKSRQPCTCHAGQPLRLRRMRTPCWPAPVTMRPKHGAGHVPRWPAPARPAGLTLRPFVSKPVAYLVGRGEKPDSKAKPPLRPLLSHTGVQAHPWRAGAPANMPSHTTPSKQPSHTGAKASRRLLGARSAPNR